jgi:NAD(P)-dependent dehydrogenase (short-subunit alcohol dehydrogenase family)
VTPARAGEERTVELDGRRIIVTGGGRGIGAALVEAYAAAGARVGSLDITHDPGPPGTGATPADGPGRVTTHHCDVSDRASVDAAFAAVVDDAGGLDVLVHAAAIEKKGPAEDITVADWDETFAVNTRGTLLTNQAAFRAMGDGGGAILNFASGAGVRGYAEHGDYAASKGAVLSWTRTAAAEWGRLGITVNAICPGMWTPLYDATRATYDEEQLAAHDAAMAASTPIDGRQGDPRRDLAPFMVFMAGPGARFITGQTLVVDGGRTMVR